MVKNCEMRGHFIFIRVVLTHSSKIHRPVSIAVEILYHYLNAELLHDYLHLQKIRTSSRLWPTKIEATQEVVIKIVGYECAIASSNL